MSIPTFSISSDSDTNSEATLVVGLSTVDGTLAVSSTVPSDDILSAAAAVGAKATNESLTRLPVAGSSGGLVIAVGLGLHADTHALRDAAGAVTRNSRDQRHLEFSFDFSNVNDVLATLEGALLGVYDFSSFKSQARDTDTIEHITIRTTLPVSEADLDVVREKAEAIALVKDLVNTPPSLMTPGLLAEAALAACESVEIVSTVWDEEKLTADGFGGIVGVGAGSVNPPRLVKLSYRPTGVTRHVALIGKGITFDTGGLTLKSGSGMVGMKYDMTGAATALAVIRAVAALKVDIALTAWLCLAENMPSATATKPNDVLRIRNGKTVEVLNTDAEGRLVLADGLSIASEEMPDVMIDIATLTGAARGALGTRTVGAMGNTDDASRLVESATESGEAFWRMPLPGELRTLLNSDIADMINGRPGNSTAGMLLAGVFLSEYVGTRTINGETGPIPWIHLDIAGTADNSGSAYGFTSAGPTGVTVRSLIDFIRAGA